MLKIHQGVVNTTRPLDWQSETLSQRRRSLNNQTFAASAATPVQLYPPRQNTNKPTRFHFSLQDIDKPLSDLLRQLEYFPCHHLQPKIKAFTVPQVLPLVFPVPNLTPCSLCPVLCRHSGMSPADRHPVSFRLHFPERLFELVEGNREVVVHNDLFKKVTVLVFHHLSHADHLLEVLVLNNKHKSYF